MWKEESEERINKKEQEIEKERKNTKGNKVARRLKYKS